VTFRGFLYQGFRPSRSRLIARGASVPGKFVPRGVVWISARANARVGFFAGPYSTTHLAAIEILEPEILRVVEKLPQIPGVPRTIAAGMAVAFTPSSFFLPSASGV